MVTASVHDSAKTVLSDPARDSVRVLNLLGKRDELHRGPQALWVFHPPGWVIDPHFHHADQFQVVVQGDARIGKRAMPLGSVQYMDGYTPYGPIICGSEGMSFIFLRGHADIGAMYMPGARAEMKRHAGRSLMPIASLSLRDSGADICMNSLIPRSVDGLVAYEISLRGGSTLPAGRLAGGSGCFQLVLAGTMVIGQQELRSESCTYTPAGEFLPCLLAGEEGLHVLELQLPLE